MGKGSESERSSNIYSVASVRQIDSAAINDAGISSYTLMTRAAEAALVQTVECFPDKRRWQVICGGGNNAGDGYVLARLAREQGIETSVIAVVSTETLKSDAQRAFADFAASGGQSSTWQGELDDTADLLIDGLLGSGLMRNVEGEFARVVDAMNAHRAPIIALDIPTGIHGDSGAVLGTAIRAQLTVTFVGLKSGLFLGVGPDHVGKLGFADLRIPDECLADIDPEMNCVTSALVRRCLPRRPRDSHKGRFGHVLLVGGGSGMPGAIRLAGEAALRAGAGCVSIATHPEHAASIAAGCPELMCHGISDASELSGLLEDASIVAVGPGLGKTKWAVGLFDKVLDTSLPLVIDADGLNLLATRSLKRSNWILTPHPGEAATLLSTTTAKIGIDRPAAVRQLADKYDGCMVLKGAGSLISAGDAPLRICTDGNPGMAAPGMGDVLTGIIAALWAQGLEKADAAAIGVKIHAMAGDAAARKGERGMLAGDLFDEIRTLVNP